MKAILTSFSSVCVCAHVYLMNTCAPYVSEFSSTVCCLFLVYVTTYLPGFFLSHQIRFNLTLTTKIEKLVGEKRHFQRVDCIVPQDKTALNLYGHL